MDTRRDPTDHRVVAGDEWVHTFSTVHLQPGDTVHYWVLAIKITGPRLQITERSWTYGNVRGPTWSLYWLWCWWCLYGRVCVCVCMCMCMYVHVCLYMSVRHPICVCM